MFVYVLAKGDLIGHFVFPWQGLCPSKRRFDWSFCVSVARFGQVDDWSFRKNKMTQQAIWWGLTGYCIAMEYFGIKYTTNYMAHEL